MSSSQSRHRGLLLAAVAAIVALAVGALAVSTDDGGREATAASTLPAPDPIDDSPASTAAATTTSEVVPETTATKKRNSNKAQRKKQQAKKKQEQRTQATPAPTSTAALDPIAPPADPRAPEESAHLGGIVIPKLGVDAPLFEGIRLTTLDLGPGHWPGTAMPGYDGNAVVAAHRTSHGGVFRYIDTLVEGDEVIFTTTEGESRYLVTGTEVVPPTALWIVDQTDNPTATLFACHPPGSVAERIVVHLELAVA